MRKREMKKSNTANKPSFLCHHHLFFCHFFKLVGRENKSRKESRKTFASFLPSFLPPLPLHFLIMSSVIAHAPFLLQPFSLSSLWHIEKHLVYSQLCEHLKGREIKCILFVLSYYYFEFLYCESFSLSVRKYIKLACRIINLLVYLEMISSDT